MTNCSICLMNIKQLLDNISRGVGHHGRKWIIIVAPTSSSGLRTIQFNNFNAGTSTTKHTKAYYLLTINSLKTLETRTDQELFSDVKSISNSQLICLLPIHIHNSYVVHSYSVHNSATNDSFL